LLPLPLPLPLLAAGGGEGPRLHGGGGLVLAGLRPREAFPARVEGGAAALEDLLADLFFFFYNLFIYVVERVCVCRWCGFGEVGRGLWA
jgi:hypothetical protein